MFRREYFSAKNSDFTSRHLLKRYRVRLNQVYNRIPISNSKQRNARNARKIVSQFSKLEDVSILYFCVFRCYKNCFKNSVMNSGLIGKLKHNRFLCTPLERRKDECVMEEMVVFRAILAALFHIRIWNNSI